MSAQRWMVLGLLLSGCFRLPHSVPANDPWESSQGLSAIDGFDPARPTALYIHGWLRSSVSTPDFPNQRGWRTEGFNTLIFRWHRDAVDQGDLCMLFQVPFQCPRVSELRIWGDDTFIGERLVAQYEEFFAGHPGYAEEVRVVGHSLGAELATYLTYRLAAEHHPVTPARLELLDPFIGSDLVASGGQLPDDAVYPVPPDRVDASSRCQSHLAANIYCVMENSLYALIRDHGVAVVDYSSVTGGATARDLRLFMNYQAFNDHWMCGKSPFGSDARCLVRNEKVIALQHVAPVGAYFWSIEETAQPRNGFSARTPTAALRGEPRYLRQDPFGQDCNLGRKATLTDLGNLLFGDLPDGEVIPFSYGMADLSAWLQTWHEISEAAADQCAEALSFSNDEYLE